MKPIIILCSVVSLVFAFGSYTAAEMAKEGTAPGTLYYTSTSQMLRPEKGFLQANYDSRGVSIADNDSSPFHNTSWQCLGTVRVLKGVALESNLCTFTRIDGDKIFVSHEGKGTEIPGVFKGVCEILGGTGKCQGISGNGEWLRTPIKGPTDDSGSGSVRYKITWMMK
jgi:hypothetical protein